MSLHFQNEGSIAMLSTHSRPFAATLAVLLFTSGTALAAVPLGKEFTYQAQLKLGGVPLNDSADFEFSLYDADSNGLLVAGPIMVSDVAVLDGLFQASLDFGVDVLDGSALWLEVAVRSPHDPTNLLPFTTLDPPQPLNRQFFKAVANGIAHDKRTGKNRRTYGNSQQQGEIGPPKMT